MYMRLQQMTATRDCVAAWLQHAARRASKADALGVKLAR